jgi:phosphoribosyl-ATP pyrophosphohydrolase
MNSSETLTQIDEILQSRLSADPESSYTAALYSKGLDAILKKIGEEATETVMAAKDGDAEKIIYEIADLWFHTMVLLSQQGLSSQQVIDELAKRMGTSGLTEKRARQNR